ncbi:CPBP family intramembrane glutamic endopeptidase [Rubrivirga sp. S365]|uniref:CPBP family intramembrane glutamic endopeptidase n=1 Tax=Rubrivirga sp. S365 TaxID=3076080 RepID=UPI0028C95E1E|nr:CPBP family intramembrane glutamic endopeptidase [Rubrivirga sp. S365]MDT7855588.1 CPBP family intramembrane glutamic endopeptidase [Rubrivirga sp. S365]
MLPVLAVALAASGSRRTGSAALLFLLLLTLDGFLVSAPVVYDVAQVPGANWNWTGKALSLAWALAFIGFGPLSRRDVGLTVRQRPNSLRPAVLVTVGLVLLGVTIGAVFGGGGPLRVETLAYQLTMPGLAEELAFRGVFLALLHRAIPAEAGAAVSWWPAVVTTLAFAFTHSPSLEGGRIAFAFLPFLLPLVAGAAFAWLREKTGSLLWPTIAHNGLNAAIFVSGSVAGAA